MNITRNSTSGVHKLVHGQKRMQQSPKPAIPSVIEWHELQDTQARLEVVKANVPVVLRGLVKHWPLVQYAEASFESLAKYLLKFDAGLVFQAMIAPPSVQGRLFYGTHAGTFNFKRMNGYLRDALDIWAAQLGKQTAPTFYIGSVSVEQHFPGLQHENVLDLLDSAVEPNIWMGNAVTVPTHNDLSENIACIAAGSRRFTLFPPDQAENLYVGPEGSTPAGRPISLVKLHSPDFQKYPRFKVALQHAQVAELRAGDALYIPTNWWHNVESLGDFNILVNYWWKGDPPPLHKIP